MRAPQPDPGPAPGTTVSLNDAGSADGAENDAPAMDGMVDFTHSPQARKSENTLGGSSTLHFAMNVEASVAYRPSSQRNLESKPVPDIRINPWQKGDPRRKDALPAPDTDNERNQRPTSYISSSSEFLPKHHVAQLLFERYFSTVNPIWPFLLKNECSDLLNRTWDSQESSDAMDIAQLNMIFCLSCQSFNGHLDERPPFDDTSRASFEFYSSAREYIVSNAFDLTNIRMLQVLLLMAQYQQSTLRSRQCYLTIGHATRMAQELGLPFPLPQSSCVSPLGRELRLRLWWGCFSLDR